MSEETKALLKKVAVVIGIVVGGALVLAERRHMDRELEKHNKRVEELSKMSIRTEENH